MNVLSKDRLYFYLKYKNEIISLILFSPLIIIFSVFDLNFGIFIFLISFFVYFLHKYLPIKIKKIFHSYEFCDWQAVASENVARNVLLIKEKQEKKLNYSKEFIEICKYEDWTTIKLLIGEGLYIDESMENHLTKEIKDFYNKLKVLKNLELL